MHFKFGTEFMESNLRTRSRRNGGPHCPIAVRARAARGVDRADKRRVGKSIVVGAD